MKNEEVARAFYDGYGDGVKGVKNFFIEEVKGVFIAFSYGEHFPISIKFTDGYLFNKNGYSQSTSKHKNLILSYIKSDLSDEDYKTTEELKAIVNAIKYDGVKSKADLIEKQI